MQSTELINWLISNSSYECPLSPEDISEGCFNSGDVQSAEDMLKQLVDKPQLLGVTVREREGKYYVELPFSEADIVILKATLLGIPYYEDFHQNEVIERLNAFIPGYMRETDSIKPHIRKYNGMFYRSVAEIIKAIYPADYSSTHSLKKLSFEYCHYDSSKELQPNVRNNGKKLSLVNPLKIVCLNNLFYLITFFVRDGEITYINYRIDKMKNVRCTDIPADHYEDHISEEEKYYLELKNRIQSEKEAAMRSKKIYEGSGADVAAEDCAKHMDRCGFNIGEYISKHPTMFNDRIVESLKMRADRKCIGRIIDTFGFEPDITDESESTVIVTLYNTSFTSVRQFALQYYDEVEILDPTVREELKTAISTLAAKYKE